MDPISFYSGLLELSSSLANIVNIALGTQSGKRILDSSLRELPILFSLVEELKITVLNSPIAIPKSTALAFIACQTDIARVIDCLSKRGLIGFGQSHHGFSQLQKQISNNGLESESHHKPRYARSRASKKVDGRYSVKELLHLFDFGTLNKRVDSFKGSVLLLHDIAME